MKWSARLATIAGIDIKVHATFLLVLALGAYEWGGSGGWQGAAFGMLLMVLLFASVALHELGHSLVAKAVGVRVREIILLPIGGVAMMTGRPKKALHELLIALAGPAVNVVLALGLGAVSIAGLWTGVFDMSALTSKGMLDPSLSTLVTWLLTANVTLAIFNMLPAFPMDGGRVLRAGLSMMVGYETASRFASRLGQVLAIALGGYGLMAGNPMLALIGVFVFLGASQERAADTIRSVLSGLHAADVVERPSVTLTAWQRVGDVARMMIGMPQRYYPVLRGEQLVGVMSRDAIMAVVGAGGADIAIDQVMDDKVPTVQASDTLESVLETLASAGARVALVVDENGWVGLLSQSHAIQAASMLHALQRPGDGPSDANRARIIEALRRI